MHNRIAITEDLADLFVALSLEENYCTYMGRIDKDNRLYMADYILRNLKNQQGNLSELFSMLTHLLILYDNIELPILNTAFQLKGRIKSFAEIKNDMPSWFYGRGYPAPFEEDVFPDEQAIPLKPFIINRCLKAYNNPRYLVQFAIRTTGSLKKLYSQIFDRYYNRANLVINPYIELILATNPMHYFNDEEPIEPQSDRACVAMAFNHIQESLRNLMLIQNVVKNDNCDFYTPTFSEFQTATNTNDAYCILKNQISMIIDEQPAFESLTDVLRFRNRHHHDIITLRDEVTTLEALLIQGEKEQAIQKAISDVRSANQALIKNTAVKKTARLATYLSVPISLLELYTFGTSYSIAIGVVGTTTQFMADYNDSKNNWLFVAR